MKNKHEFTIKIDGEDWEKAQDHAFQKRNKNAKIDGFRPGKVPVAVVKQRYAKELLDDAKQDAQQKGVGDAHSRCIGISQMSKTEYG